MAVITLTSDWGLKDPYLAEVKASILVRMPKVTLVDISHEIPPFQADQAAFIVRSTWHRFPKGTVHLIAVNTEETNDSEHCVLFYKGHFFIGNDNGIFSMIFDELPEKIHALTIPQESNYFTFSARDRFVQAAVHLAGGGPVEELGPPRQNINEKILLKPVTSEDLIKGHVIYIDRYENVITNISEQLFTEIQQKRRFKITFRSYSVDRIVQSYTEVPQGEILALFGSHGLLEIAMNQGNAAGLLGLDYKDMIRIEFE
ncbi:MAG: SAM-dependent chlorinase/fluorinase [Bacteroidales bacterium]